MLQLTPYDLINLDREYCRRSLANFVERAWPVLEPSTELKWGWALGAMSEHLEAVHTGEIKDLLCNVPPGCMKSMMFGVMFPAWEWGPMKSAHRRFLGTAHREDLAIRDNVLCRRLIMSDWYQERWPIKLFSDSNAKTKFINDKTGFREAMPFRSLTGSRGDRVILDDPLPVDAANSPPELASAETIFTETLPTRLNDPAKSSILVIMQRIHQNDTSGVILSRSLPFVHLMLPMEYEPDRKCHTVIGFKDPRTTEDELLFPERFSREVVERDKKTMGSFATAGQFQQRPVPRGGGMFQQEWLNIIESLPPKVRWIRGWDLAGTTKKYSAYTVGAKVGITPDKKLIIGDIRRTKKPASQVLPYIKEVAKMDGKKVRGSLPKDPGQAGESQAQAFVKGLIGYRYRATKETGNKTQRAEPVAIQAEAGNLYILKGPWNKDLIDEMTMFPNGKFKDQVDAVSRAVDELLNGKSYTLDNLDD